MKNFPGWAWALIIIGAIVVLAVVFRKQLAAWKDTMRTGTTGTTTTTNSGPKPGTGTASTVRDGTLQKMRRSGPPDTVETWKV